MAYWSTLERQQQYTKQSLSGHWQQGEWIETTTQSWPDSVTVGEEVTDEMTGVSLPRDGVTKAGAEEVAWFDKVEAYKEALDETCLS